jgi:hypothetical protein
VGGAGAQAAPPPDPYADAVLSSSNFNNASNALGAPDGVRSAAPVSILASSQVVLDMGAGEEGSGPLRIHYNILVGVSTTVTFLDASQNVLATQVILLDLLSSLVTVPYSGATPYRYVRISVGLGLGLGLDGLKP